MTDVDYKSLSLEQRLALLPELMGIEVQLFLPSLGQPGPVHYFIADLTDERVRAHR